MQLLNVTFHIFFMHEVHWWLFCVISANQQKGNNISSDFIHQGIHHFPNSQSLPRTGVYSSPQRLRLSVTQFIALFVFLFSGKFKITPGGRLGGGNSWGTVGGSGGLCPSSVWAGRGLRRSVSYPGVKGHSSFVMMLNQFADETNGMFCFSFWSCHGPTCSNTFPKCQGDLIFILLLPLFVNKGCSPITGCTRLMLFYLFLLLKEFSKHVVHFEYLNNTFIL